MNFKSEITYKRYENGVQQGLGVIDQESTNKVVERKGLKVSWELLIQIRECIARANICKQSKSLHDIG
jgi:hypothetical protein